MKDKETRRLVSVRLPAETRAQLEWLAPIWDGNKTSVVIVAVAALYREQAGTDAVETVKVAAK